MHHRKLKIGILILMFSILLILLVGTIIFSYLEGWSLLDSFYFVAMTATTVGYGDFAPTDDAGKIATIIFSLMIIPFVLYGFSIIAKYNVEAVYSKIRKVERQQTMTEAELEEAIKNLEGQRRKLKEQEKVNLEQEKQIASQKTKLRKTAEELGVVEDVMIESLEEEKPKKRRKK